MVILLVLFDQDDKLTTSVNIKILLGMAQKAAFSLVNPLHSKGEFVVKATSIYYSCLAFSMSFWSK
jgi:hypothetical protein